MHVMPVVPLPLFGFDEPDTTAPTDTFVHVDMPDRIDVHIVEDKESFVDASSVAPQYVKSWDDYVGQQHIKDELMVYIDESFANVEPLPHILLAASMPGAGKTTLARLIAKQIDQRIIMLAPPVKPDAVYEAAMQMKDFEVLFIDEIHKLADHGPAASENLYHMLEERVLYLNGRVVQLNHFTVIGATTDADKLPEPLLDRFPVQPFFQPYSLAELVRITKNFCDYYRVTLLPETMVALAKACRGTPRIARSLVEGAKALQTSYGRPVTGNEVLWFKQIDPDGMTRLHKSYVTALYKYGRQYDKGVVTYRAGVDTMMSLLRLNSNGVARIERFLIQSGFLVKTGRGRVLTERGVSAAIRYMMEENG